MPKLTVLDMVQDILSDMDSDEINNIGDTAESDQVAQIIKTTYYDIVNRLQPIPEHFELDQLEGLADTDKPTYMSLPTSPAVLQIQWIKYNTVILTDTALDYTDIPYLEPTDFIDRISTRDSDDATVQSVTDDSGVTLLIRNDKAPEWWTAFDDDTIIFDSFDSEVDSTLQTSKSAIYVTKEPLFTISDTFTPDLDENLFPLLLSESKSTAFVVLKQIANPKAEQIARRQTISAKKNKSKVPFNPNDNRPDFGRRGRGNTVNRIFKRR